MTTEPDDSGPTSATPATSSSDTSNGTPATPASTLTSRLTPKQARSLAWQTGYLEYLCRDRPKQVELYRRIRDAWENSDSLVFSMLIHRQFGKSRMLSVFGLEECLRTPNTNVVYLTDTKIHAEQIVVPLVNSLLEECPKALRPLYKRERRCYEFANGSTLTILGMDFDGLDKVRGVRARLLLIDEAAFQTQIKEALAVGLPILSTTGGFCVVASTPPSLPGHPYVEVHSALAAIDMVSVIPLDDNPDATPAMRRAAEQYRELLGEAAYRREWQCDMSGVGDDTVVLPEWPLVKSWVVQTVKDLPARPDHYVGYDIGGRDWDAFCFGTWDHVLGRFVVQGELFLRAESIAEMARMVKEKIEALGWDRDGGDIHMFADWNNAHLVNEFRRQYGLNFLPTKKPEKVAQIHEVRQMMRDRELFIAPDLEVLPRTCERARWDRTHKGFMRAQQADLEKAGLKPIGHADMLDALVYCVVNIRRGKEHKDPTAPKARYMDRYQQQSPGVEPIPIGKGRAPKPVTQQAKDFAASMYQALTGKGPTSR